MAVLFLDIFFVLVLIVLEKDKIINECNLYLMNENELDYNIPEEYKRILK